jgi:nitrate reductase assembly molybdenum cofactor insertion protein NarJ
MKQINQIIKEFIELKKKLSILQQLLFYVDEELRHKKENLFAQCHTEHTNAHLTSLNSHETQFRALFIESKGLFTLFEV